jgi:hypothetical protein
LIQEGFLSDSAPSPVTTEVVVPESSVARPDAEPQPEAKEPTAVPSATQRLRRLDRMSLDADLPDREFHSAFIAARKLEKK